MRNRSQKIIICVKFSRLYSYTAAEKDGTVLFYLWRVVICKLKMKGEALHNDWMDYLCRIMAFSDQNLTPKAKQIKLYICISMFKLKLFCITVSNQQYFTSMRGFVKVPKYLHVYIIPYKKGFEKKKRINFQSHSSVETIVLQLISNHYLVVFVTENLTIKPFCHYAHW